MNSVALDDVRAYWEAHPLSASAIPHPLGSREYFEYYDRLHEANESVEFSALLHEYRDFAGRKVLDVGCGNGYVLSRYARAGAEVFGVDLTDAAVGLCRKRFEYMGLTGDFRRANAEALPFPDATFDWVTSMGVLRVWKRKLDRFSEVEMFAGLLEGDMIIPRAGRFIPTALVRPFERRWGWFLYAKGRKPA